jgi:hypothetical protein
MQSSYNEWKGVATSKANNTKTWGHKMDTLLNIVAIGVKLFTCEKEILKQ